MPSAFDIVIVGGGSAGAVLAGRLSEQPNRTVLVIEAGPVFTADTVPESIRRLSVRLDPAHDWGDRAETVDGRTLPYTRGRVAGGCSAINATMALRAVPDDLDGWGVEGWSWDDLLPHFVAIERDLDVKAPYHGTEGPLPIVRHGTDALGPLSAAFEERCAELGFPLEPDHNDPGSSGGAGPIPMNRDGANRVSAADAWLYPALDRPNLTAWGDTAVDRVVLSGGRAVAVECRRAGVTERVDAGEVVIAAGVLQSPAILWRSGVDLPGIGANLSDHPSVPVHLLPGTELPRRVPTMQSILRAPSPVTGRAFDAWLLMTAGSPVADVPGMQSEGATLLLPTLYFSPQSVVRRGRISPTPDGVRIEWPFLDDPQCLAEFRAGIRLAAELAAGGALGELFAGLHEPHLDLADDASIDAYVRRTHRAFLHGCGTCALGDVVDAELRVHGVDGLRVCDTSVFPSVPRANPNLTVLAVADRAATLITA